MKIFFSRGTKELEMWAIARIYWVEIASYLRPTHIFLEVYGAETPSKDRRKLNMLSTNVEISVMNDLPSFFENTIIAQVRAMRYIIEARSDV